MKPGATQSNRALPRIFNVIFELFVSNLTEHIKPKIIIGIANTENKEINIPRSLRKVRLRGSSNRKQRYTKYKDPPRIAPAHISDIDVRLFICSLLGGNVSF